MQQQTKGYLTSLCGLAVLTALAFGMANQGLAALIDLTPTDAVNSTNFVSLADLVSGTAMGVSVGDKEFMGFSYLPSGDMPLAADVKVYGFKDLEGNWGITLHGAFNDLPDATSSAATFGFQVQVSATGMASGFRISDAHLFIGGVGGTEVTVDETFQQSNQTLHTFVNGGSQQLSDNVIFNPTLSVLNVTKTIFAMAGANDILPARLTAIDQSFSQSTVPEPASMVLCLMGAVAVAAVGRRKQTK
jgi:hypothetical protein